MNNLFSITIPPEIGEARRLMALVADIFNPTPVVAPTGALAFAPAAVTGIEVQLFRTTQQLLQAEGALAQAIALIERVAARVQPIGDLRQRFLSFLNFWLSFARELLRVVSALRQNAQQFGGRQVFERQTLEILQSRARRLAEQTTEMANFLIQNGIQI